MPEAAIEPATPVVDTAVPTSAPTSSADVATPETTNQVVPENDAQGQTNQPVSQPVDQTANTLTDDESKYLKSQNIDLSQFGIDASNHTAVDNFINFHKSMRKPEQPVPSDFAQAPSPQTAPTPAPQPAVNVRTPSQLDIITMKNYLDSTYPEAKDKMGTKQFYDDMRSFGLSPVTANGEFNVSAITRYADIVNTKAENERLKANSNRVNPNLIPDATNSMDVTNNTFSAQSPMNMNQAENIVMAGNREMRSGKTLSAEDQAVYNQAVHMVQYGK